ncbi:uncharacterized protein LOC131074679 [Cryptomeria japonica]|uniref:uncharacterized protein LOC131074679 n=1 Tax=Cryptomeria japonica TaxID=3369 RepID=UPI0027D9D05A|nr:uncharacterized protein LOC131074679 [Cryptomeria japonica]
MLIKHEDAKIEINVPIQVPYTNLSKGEPLQQVINFQNCYVEDDALVDPNNKIRSHSNDCVGLNIPKASNSKGGKNSHYFCSTHETNSRYVCQFCYHEKHLFNMEGCIFFVIQICQYISVWDPGDHLSWIRSIQKHDFGPSTLATLTEGLAYGFGGEKDIIMTTVRTNKIGFLSNWSDANTVLMYEPFCLGTGSMLVKTDSVWKELAKNAIERKYFLDPNVDSKMVEVIRNVVDQLNDLSNKDSILLNNTVWKITYINEFKKLFTRLKNLYVQKHTINTLWRLVNDRQWARKHAGPAEQSLINEHAILELHLAEIGQGMQVSQVLKIWNVLTLKELHGLGQGLENVIATYTLGNVEQCKVKCLGSNGRRVPPMQWKDDPEFWYKCIQKSEMLETPLLEAYEQKTISLELARVKENLLLMEFYSLIWGITDQLLTATEGSDIVFQLR